MPAYQIVGLWILAVIAAAAAARYLPWPGRKGRF